MADPKLCGSLLLMLGDDLIKADQDVLSVRYRIWACLLNHISYSDLLIHDMESLRFHWTPLLGHLT